MASSKKIFIFLALVLITIGGGIFLSQNGNSQQSISPTPIPNPVSTPTPTSEQNQPSTKTFKMSDVLTHKDSSSCWTIIDSKVYDLTSFIAGHPGGEQAILSICGKDGTQAFRGQHGDRGRANNILSTLIIGDLAQ